MALAWVWEHAYSHAITLDADSQHNAADVPDFLDTARAAPSNLIMGRPLFAADAPKARVYGREVTNFWVAIETLSRSVGDALFGFRCYPMTAVRALYQRHVPGPGMEFDTEIAVRLAWDDVCTISLETPVTYMAGGLSHFDYLTDNLRIAWLHIRLLAEAPFRLLVRWWRRGRLSDRSLR